MRSSPVAAAAARIAAADARLLGRPAGRRGSTARRSRSGALDLDDAGDRRSSRPRGRARCRRRSSISNPASTWAVSSPNRVGELVHRPLPDQPAGREDADPVADVLDLVEEVAREEDRHLPLPDERPEQIEDLGDAERVDRGRRLVEDQDVRILDQGVGDAEPLEHAPRVRARSGRRRGRSARPARAPRRSSSSASSRGIRLSRAV